VPTGAFPVDFRRIALTVRCDPTGCGERPASGGQEGAIHEESMRVLRLIAALTLAASTLTVHAQDEPQAFLFEIEPRSLALLAAVNNTGAVAVGNFAGGGGLYWMPTTGVIAAGGLVASAVSGDGRTIVGTATDTRSIQNAAIWQRATEWGGAAAALTHSIRGDLPILTPTEVRQEIDSPALRIQR
jgi:hypothetical protein